LFLFNLRHFQAIGQLLSNNWIWTTTT